MVVTFSNRHESRTFTEIDEKTRSSIDSCSSGVQSGSNNSDLDSLNSNQNSPKVPYITTWFNIVNCGLGYEIEKAPFTETIKFTETLF